MRGVAVVGSGAVAGPRGLEACVWLVDGDRRRQCGVLTGGPPWRLAGGNARADAVYGFSGLR